MKYLSYFENQDQAMSYDGQLGAPHVAYVEGGEQLLFAPYTEGVEEVKFKFENGQLTLQGEVDPAPGFVDLGLSVMWASCDVGATSPEGEGTKYAWGEESWKTIPLEFDPVYMNSNMQWKETLQPRTPSPAQVQELLDNTTATEEVLNGVSGVRYTASNGNSIFVSNAERWTNAMYINANPWALHQAVHWMPTSGLIDNNTIYSIAKTHTLLFRGVCSNLPQGGARVLEYGTEYVLEDALYCFPRTWTATQIVVSTTQSVRMYISNTPDFVVSSADQVLATCVASLEESTRAIYLSNKELAAFAKQATSDYLYVRFSCPVSTKLSVDYWTASECADESFMLYPNVPQFIAAKSRSVVYRARYSDFVGAALDIQWDGSSSLPTYIAETCDFTPTNTAAALLVKPAFSVKSGSNYLIEAEAIDTWASRIADDGYFYVRFNPTREGNVTFVTDKPTAV